MAAARFSADALELFYGTIQQEVNRRQRRPIRPAGVDFYLTRDNFNGWLRSWRMDVPSYSFRAGLLRFARKTKTRFAYIIEDEIASLESIKTQCGLLVKFSVTRDGETQYMEHYFIERGPTIFGTNNEEVVNTTFNRFIDEVKGEIEV